MSEQVATNAVLLRTSMEILLDAGAPLSVQDVLREIPQQVTLTPYWLERYKSGSTRWEVAVRFITGNAATVGWITKTGRWEVTEAGLDALGTCATADELYAELNRRYHGIDQRRKQAQQMLSDVQQFIAATLRLVEASSWTAYDDLAELAGTTPDVVADFLASGKVRLPNAYRVLNADGTSPTKGC